MRFARALKKNFRASRNAFPKWRNLDLCKRTAGPQNIVAKKCYLTPRHRGAQWRTVAQEHESAVSNAHGVFEGKTRVLPVSCRRRAHRSASRDGRRRRERVWAAPIHGALRVFGTLRRCLWGRFCLLGRCLLSLCLLSPSLGRWSPRWFRFRVRAGDAVSCTIVAFMTARVDFANMLAPLLVDLGGVVSQSVCSSHFCCRTHDSRSGNG